jgi:hypothetical protein
VVVSLAVVKVAQRGAEQAAGPVAEEAPCSYS